MLEGIPLSDTSGYHQDTVGIQVVVHILDNEYALNCDDDGGLKDGRIKFYFRKASTNNLPEKLM